MVHNSGDYSECHSVHAEQNALISASRRDMIGATLYLYGEEVGTDGSFSVINASPCPICSRMIANAGIERIICSAGEVK
jgi:dCMP deaminase